MNQQIINRVFKVKHPARSGFPETYRVFIFLTSLTAEALKPHTARVSHVLTARGGVKLKDNGAKQVSQAALITTMPAAAWLLLKGPGYCCSRGWEMRNCAATVICRQVRS
jgi:hypothetical protein